MWHNRTTTMLQRATTQKSGATEVVRFRADSGLKSRISKLAKKQGVNDSHVLRQALIEYLAKQGS